jgi:hypothetical protein
MKKTFINIALLVAFAATSTFVTSCKKDDDNTTEESISSDVITIKASDEGVGTTTWTKNNVYVLDGFVFVNDGQTLTIEPGTIIKGAAGQGASASALIVAQGGKLMAEGTATEPIIFTSVADKIAYNDAGTIVPSTNLDQKNRGLWGGIIVLGKASSNNNPSIKSIEGIPTNESRGQYGGTEDADNSGSLKYISIRHGGTNIGADNEINGLTLGGVGSGTTVEHIEVYANADDGIEFFGGTVSVKYAVVSNGGDDCFDYDEGWRGNGQFWVAIQADDAGDRGGEHDGGPSSNETGTPYATPEIRNATYIGNGDNRLITFRDNAGGEYINSIFQGWDKGIDVEDLTSVSSQDRLDDGNLKIEDNVFYDIAAGTTVDKLIVSSEGADLSSHVNVSGNVVTNPGISATNPVPTKTLTEGSAPTESWFDNVKYKGAFSTSNWAENWTKTFE